MALFDSKKQKAEAQIAGGRNMIATAEKGTTGLLPQKLSTSDKLKLHKAGMKEVLGGTMALNKLKAAQSTDSSN